MTKKLNCVMLIDDDADDNFFHQIVLRETNITDNIQVVTSGFEALKYLTSESVIPDLIFLDINMPKMNGWEFLQEYNKLNIAQKAKIIIIMLTTSLNPADEAKANNINDVVAFKSKPLTADALEDILNKYFTD
jgi:CheY-like chemotaxis protein